MLVEETQTGLWGEGEICREEEEGGRRKGELRGEKVEGEGEGSVMEGDAKRRCSRKREGRIEGWERVDDDDKGGIIKRVGEDIGRERAPTEKNPNSGVS